MQLKGFSKEGRRGRREVKKNEGKKPRGFSLSLLSFSLPVLLPFLVFDTCQIVCVCVCRFVVIN